MVQALVIRQAFMVVDFLLALAVVATAAIVTQRLFATSASAAVVVAGVETESAPPPKMLRDVGARSEYDVIVRSGFFGDAGRWDPGDAPVAEKAPEIVDNPLETELNLRLLGVSAIDTGDPLASAIIQDMDQKAGGAAGVYWTGDPVIQDVTLLEIHPRMVILENRKKTPPLRERLSMDDDKNDPAQMASAMVHSPGPSIPTANSNAPERIELKRDELLQELYVNYSDMVSTLRPKLKTDDQGNVVGLTADNISQVPMAQKLGLQDNDVLQTINNEKIDSEQKILEIMTRYQNAGSFRIGILRDGKAKVITYRLN